MENWLLVAALLLSAASLAFLAIGLLALRSRRALGAVSGVLLAVLLLSVAALLATLAVATQGYRALTFEELAAAVTIVPEAPQRFSATFRFPDGREEQLTLSGDELYVDAHILKWKPIVNVLGLHTAYELDRVAGRYRLLADETAKPRTVFSLARPKLLDLFDLRRRYALLAPLLDAEYGSATFVDAARPAKLELRVSTSGLLIRPAPGSPTP
jgi:hypothetical protein